MNSDTQAAEKKKIILAAGGTGGHIWPAISFGSWIKKRHPECELRYICGSRPLEREIYGAASLNPEILPMDGSPLSGRNALQRLGRLRALFSSYSMARGLIARFRPDAALLFGGYLSFPMLLACKRAGVRCALHEQNARAGRATRAAAKLGTEIYSGWQECLPLKEDSYLRIGVPVRAFELPSKEEALRRLKIEDKMQPGPVVVVFSGSLGSSSVKDEICSLAGSAPFNDWNFLLPAQAERMEKVGENLWLLPKIWEAGLLYAAADMLALRAGGSTLTEAAVLGIPSLVIPWKGATDNHQYHNALAFVSENAGLIWNEGEGRDALASSLIKLKKMSEKYKKTAGRFYGRGDLICENLWSALFPTL
ncbi:MAG: UDP-N-acetylglucosamine--N-acetylmuramyl-(pentapeptide) pyrophosphoryl-undecaprenol N-acetylglucosamine transferase [Synergistaceae bacterium]|nr:UDP-N-acetylglucosamine--N-acetylmuramyl-(pentapeptide) pyrophosphoryl-undecaprenol N-acetylglucosamine transferase [Synergistaceae bacterium]